MVFSDKTKAGMILSPWAAVLLRRHQAVAANPPE
jgi:hypothetical protein